MSCHDLQRRLAQARGTRTRREVVEAALAIPGAPDDFTENRLRQLETQLQAPPRDGAELRALIAALGLNLLDVLTDLGYWPPLPTPYGESPARLLLEAAAKLGGWRVAPAGDKIVFHLQMNLSRAYSELVDLLGHRFHLSIVDLRSLPLRQREDENRHVTIWTGMLPDHLFYILLPETSFEESAP